MNIKKIWIRNIHTHKDTTITFPDGLIAMSGDTGSGKTTALSAFYGVAYGKMPPYEGGISDRITKGHIGDAYLAAEFEMDGVNYLAERKIRKTASAATQECMLINLDTNKPVAGPKVVQFEDAMIALIGSEKLFSASVFQAQKEYFATPRDLVNCKPTARKEILCEILDTDSLQSRADSFGDRLKQANKNLEAFEYKVDQLEKMLADVDETAIATYKAMNERHADKIMALTVDLDAVIKAEALAEEQKRQTEALIAQKSEIEMQGKAKRSEIEATEAVIERLRKSMESISEIKEHQAKREAVIDNNADIQKINAQIQLKINANAEIRTAWLTECRKVEQHNSGIASALSDIRDLKMQIKSRMDAWEQKRIQLTAQTKILEDGDFSQPNCKACRFLKSAIDAKAELAETNPPDISDLEAKLALINVFEAKEMPPEPTYADVQPLFDLSPIPRDRAEELQTAMTADSRIGELARNIDRLRMEREELVLKYQEIVVPDFAPPLISGRQLIKSQIFAEQAEIDENNRQISVIEQQAIQNDTIRAKMKELENHNANDVKQQKILAYLQKAFGKNGIQALLVDTALPHISQISNEILSYAKEGCYLEWSTEKENKDGTTREGMEIMFTDNNGTRDINEVSGGENQLLKWVVRVSIAIYQSQKAKKKLRTLFLDESISGMSDGYKDGWMRAMVKVGEYFDKAIIVSHDESFLSDIEQKIFFKGGKVL